MRGQVAVIGGRELRACDVLEEFHDAILLAASELKPGRLRGRPMAIADVEPDGTLWFFATVDTPKSRETIASGEAYVVCQSAARQVFMRGALRAIADRGRIDAVWDEAMERRLGVGRNDPRLCLVRFIAEEGEHWDHSGMKGARYFLDPVAGSFLPARPIMVREAPRMTGTD
jgi:general stress protein 26